MAGLGLRPGVTSRSSSEDRWAAPCSCGSAEHGRGPRPVQGAGGGRYGWRESTRRFLKRVSAAGALSGAALLGKAKPLIAQSDHDHTSTDARLARRAWAQSGEVDHAANGFHPNEILTDFDGGEVSKDRSGRTVREYKFVNIDKEIEVAPGVFFPAWTYNDRVPGPTIRATEGDRIRINLVNSSDHPHTIHFHGFHPSGMDGVPGVGEAQSGEASSTTSSPSPSARISITATRCLSPSTSIGGSTERSSSIRSRDALPPTRWSWS